MNKKAIETHRPNKLNKRHEKFVNQLSAVRSAITRAEKIQSISDAFFTAHRAGLITLKPLPAKPAKPKVWKPAHKTVQQPVQAQKDVFRELVEGRADFNKLEDQEIDVVVASLCNRYASLTSQTLVITL